MCILRNVGYICIQNCTEVILMNEVINENQLDLMIAKLVEVKSKFTRESIDALSVYQKFVPDELRGNRAYCTATYRLYSNTFSWRAYNKNYLSDTIYDEVNGELPITTEILEVILARLSKEILEIAKEQSIKEFYNTIANGWLAQRELSFVLNYAK